MWQYVLTVNMKLNNHNTTESLSKRNTCDFLSKGSNNIHCKSIHLITLIKKLSYSTKKLFSFVLGLITFKYQATHIACQLARVSRRI